MLVFTNMKEVYDFKDYRKYLSFVFSKENTTRVTRAEICNFIKCQHSFISQVLSGRTHISLEHAVLISQYLKHQSDERKFFLLLVQLEKSGNKTLRDFFQEQIENELNRRQPIKEILEVKDDLSAEDQAIYYSYWWYAAIHILVAFPEFRTVDNISKRLQLDQSIVKEALQFLISRGIVVSNKDGLGIGKVRIHVGSKSPLVSRHHMNWRAKCMNILEGLNDNNIHYSAVIGISYEGANHIKKELMKFLKSTEPIVRDSKEEAPFVLLTDFFQL